MRVSSFAAGPVGNAGRILSQVAARSTQIAPWLGLPGLLATAWFISQGSFVGSLLPDLCSMLLQALIIGAGIRSGVPRHWYVFLCIGFLVQGARAAPDGAIAPITDHSSRQVSIVCGAVSVFQPFRPLPTPCRRRTVGEYQAPENQQDIPGPTLLEDAASRQDCAAFSTARALLESLHIRATSSQSSGQAEHSSCSSARPTACEAKTPLSLAAHLPSFPTHDLSQVGFNLPFSLDEVQTLLLTHWHLPTALPTDLRLHTATRCALDTCLCIDDLPEGDIDRCDIFTDGAFNERQSAWAFAVVGYIGSDSFLVGWARGPVALEGAPHHIGADIHTALNGERTALFWALAWTLQFADRLPCTIWIDSQVASGQTSGRCGYAASAVLAQSCRALAQVAESLGGVQVSDYRHIRAHKGHAYNELADTLAGSYSVPATAIPSGNASLTQWVKQDCADWLWLYIAAVRNPEMWPTLHCKTFIDRDRRQQTGQDWVRPEALFSTKGHQEHTSGSRLLSFCLRLVTINVQTLEDGTNQAETPGRIFYVRSQLEHCGATVTGLQETRAKSSDTCVSETHIRFTSACDDKGNGGVEAWFSMTLPYAWEDGYPIYFHQNDFRVLAWNPRYLIIRFARGSTRITFAVCHALSATHPDRDRWWSSFSCKLRASAQDDEVVLLGDLNTRFTDSVAGRVGDLVWPSPHPVPQGLIAILARHDLWIPSTFACCHYGDSHTWVSPTGSTVARIDYVVIPERWFVQANSSWILYDVDFGQTGLDHYAAALDVSFHKSTTDASAPRQTSIDVRQLSDPDAYGTVQHICQTAPLVPWHVDIHSHYEILAHHFRSQLSALFPAKRASCKTPYFSTSTWGLRQQRLWLRRRTHRILQQLHTCEVRCAFRAWIGSIPPGRLFIGVAARCLIWCKEVKQHISELRQLKPCLRRNIVQDRAAYLHKVACEAINLPTKDVVTKLRPLLGPPKRRQRQQVALPVVRLEDGDIAADNDEATARWIRHFCSLEDGHPTSAADLTAHCRQRQADADLDAVTLDAQQVPSRAFLEASLRRAPTGRACGNDGIPADLLHLHANTVSLPLFQVALKASFRIAEPLQWKGGALHAIWKRKGPVDVCDSHRGILVSSAAGKAYRGALRRKAAPILDVAAGSLQIGGRTGQPVQIANQVVRVFQTFCHQQGLSHSIVFLDLKEAFHRVVRPLILGGPLDDRHVIGILTALRLPPADFVRLQAYVRDTPIVTESGAGPWTSSMLGEVLSDTWFSWSQTSDLAVVRGGTRPGDNLADMLFSFLFAEVLCRIRRAITSQDLTCQLGWHPSWRRSLGSALAPQSTGPGPIDVSWMDDLALLSRSKTAAGAVSSTQRIASILLDECLHALLMPNLSKGKTEAIVSLVGPGSRRLKQDLFTGSDPTFPLQSAMWPEARLHITSAYKHLGGIIHHTGSVLAEARARVGFAWTAFRKHRRRVFAAPCASPRDKSILLRSLVLSTMCFGIGTWPIVEASTQETFHTALVRMSRIMLRPQYSHAATSHMCPGLILAIARVSSAATLFHVERLRHLAMLARRAPDELWALLHHQGTWLELARSSVSWLVKQLEISGYSRSFPRCWEECLPILLSAPSRWRALIRRANITADLWERWHAEVMTYHGLTLRLLLRHGALREGQLSDAEPKTEICAVCKQSFKNLREWSHHAFKRHGRVRPERTLVDGTQCPVCLRQYASNGRLCNHLRHSTACRHSLVSAGHSVAPQPGKGSRRFDTGSDVLAPAAQALGPSRQWEATQIIEEPDRPSSGILDRITDCLCHEEDFHASYQSLLDRLRVIFSEECLQQSRLRATANYWHRQIEELFRVDEEWSVNWSAWHCRAADFLNNVDFVEWLLPDAREGCDASSTFRDAAVILPWLDCSHVLLPEVEVGSPQIARAFAISRASCAPFHVSLLITCEQCAQDPRCLDFSASALDSPSDGILLLSGVGLISELEAPKPLRSFRYLEGRLRNLRLFSDFVRGTFRLWTSGVPAILLVPTLSCPGLNAVSSVAPYKTNRQGIVFLANFPLLSVFPTCFTSSN